MDYNQCTQVLSIVKQAYPYMKEQDINSAKMQIALYHTALVNYDFELACMALYEHIATKKFAPSPAELTDLCKEIQSAKNHPVWDVFHIHNLAAGFESEKVNEYVNRDAVKALNSANEFQLQIQGAIE